MSKQMNQLISIGFRKWCYNLSGFNQYGLWRDDLLREDADVTEALRRVPQEIIDRRNFRIVRAMQLSACHRILPKEEWTKFEERIFEKDTAFHGLLPVNDTEEPRWQVTEFPYRM